MEYPITWVNAERKSRFSYKKAVIEMALAITRLRLIYSPLSRFDWQVIKEIEGAVYKEVEKIK